MKLQTGFIEYLEYSIRENWNLDALTDYKGATLQYKDVARKIAKFHIVFEKAGINPGDKIAVCGRNSANWAVVFLATVTYGAVIVPILHEFKPDNIHNIVNHSGAKLLFAGDQIWENLDESAMPLLDGIWQIADFTPVVCRNERLLEAYERLNEYYGERYPSRFTSEHVSYRKSGPEELAVINYTSGPPEEDSVDSDVVTAEAVDKIASVVAEVENTVQNFYLCPWKGFGLPSSSVRTC